MFKWPKSFIPARTFNIETSSNVIRSEMDSGRVRQRRRQTLQLQTLGVEWDFNDTNYGYFQSIVHNLLNDGADWFEMSLPLGDGFKCYVVRFVAPAKQKAAYQDVMGWHVTAVLEHQGDTASEDECCIALMAALDFQPELFLTTVGLAEDAYNNLT